MSTAEAALSPSKPPSIKLGRLFKAVNSATDSAGNLFQKNIEVEKLDRKVAQDANTLFIRELKIPHSPKELKISVADAVEAVRRRFPGLETLDTNAIANNIVDQMDKKTIQEATCSSSVLHTINQTLGAELSEEDRKIFSQLGLRVKKVTVTPPTTPTFIPQGWDALRFSSQTGKILNRPLSPFTAATIAGPDLFFPARLPLAVGADTINRLTDGKFFANIAAFSLISQNPEDTNKTMGFMLKEVAKGKREIENLEKLSTTKGLTKNEQKLLKDYRRSHEFNKSLFTSLNNLKVHSDKFSGPQKFLYGAAARVFRVGHFMGKLSNNITTLAFAAPYLFTDPSKFALTFTNQLITYRAYDAFHTHVIDRITGKIKPNFLGSTIGKGLLALGTRFGTSVVGKRLATLGAALLLGAPTGGWSFVIALGAEALFFLNRQLGITERLKDLTSAVAVALGLYLSKLSLTGLLGGGLGALGFGALGGFIGFTIGGPVGAVFGTVIGGLAGFVIGSKIGEALALPATATLTPTLAAGAGGVGGAAAGPAVAAIEGPLASLATQGIGATVTTLGVGGLTVGLITSSAFFIPYQGGPSPWAEQSKYITVTKTVSYQNQPLQSNQRLPSVKQGDVFTYTVQITATQSKLTNIHLKDAIQTTQASGSHLIRSFEQTRDEISPGTPWSLNYPISVDNASFFQNSILSNTLSVTADVPDQNITNEQSVASLQIIIGTPPENCPYLWPLRSRRQITQGPNCTPCQDEPICFCSHDGEQAIDIGDTPVGTPVFSTHAGTVNFDFDTQGCKGNYVTITSICNSQPFSTVYAHLNSFASSLTPGQTISANQLIGYSGNSAKDPRCSTGPHLHYATWGLNLTDFLKSVDGLITPNCGRNTDSPPTCGFTPK